MNLINNPLYQIQGRKKRVVYQVHNQDDPNITGDSINTEQRKSPRLNPIPTETQNIRRSPRLMVNKVRGFTIRRSPMQVNEMHEKTFNLLPNKTDSREKQELNKDNPDSGEIKKHKKLHVLNIPVPGEKQDMSKNPPDSGEIKQHKKLDVSFSKGIEPIKIPKPEFHEHKLKQILKLICAAAIGVIGNSESGFIFNNGRNLSSLNNTEDIIKHNHNPILNAIEIDIGMPSTSLQMKATKDYIQKLQFIEALKDEEDDDWSFLPEKILTKHLRKTPR